MRDTLDVSPAWVGDFANDDADATARSCCMDPYKGLAPIVAIATPRSLNSPTLTEPSGVDALHEICERLMHARITGAALARDQTERHPVPTFFIRREYEDNARDYKRWVSLSLPLVCDAGSRD